LRRSKALATMHLNHSGKGRDIILRLKAQAADNVALPKDLAWFGQGQQTRHPAGFDELIANLNRLSKGDKPRQVKSRPGYKQR
jgi:hypothetical protein